MRRYWLFGATLLTLATVVPARAGQTAPMRWLDHEFFDGATVEGASASLDRNLDAQPAALSMTLQTNGLSPGHAYTVWWVTFNAPDRCLSHPGGTVRCGQPDGLNPAAESSTDWAAGAVARSDGTADFTGLLVAGDRSHVAFPVMSGLTNPEGAEVALVVRDHGPAIEGSDQTTTFNGGCSNALPGATGTPGDYACANQQVAEFPAS